MLNNQTFYQLSEPVTRRWAKLPDWFYLAIVATLAGATIILAQLVGGIFFVLIFGVDALNHFNDGPTFTGLLITSFLPMFFFTWLWLQLLERRGLASVGMGTAGAARNYLRGVVIGIGMIGGSILLMSLFGYTAVESPFNGASIAGAGLVLLGWIVQGAGEEVVTRGLILQIFGRIAGSTVGILVSAFIFTAFHLLNANLSAIGLLNLFLFGIFAALYTLYEGGLWGIFAIHSFWNWAQGNLFGMQVSGNEIESAIVFDLMETGPDTLTGGLFGPEGGLIVTFVLLVAMGGVYLANQRQNRVGSISQHGRV